MDFHCLSQVAATLLGLVLILHMVWKFLITCRQRKGEPVPEPFGAWPLIGHLLLLLKDQVPAYLTFATLADKYGPIFSIRVGMRRLLVISSWEAAKDCLKINDKVFLNRPSYAASRFLSYNNTFFGLCPYGSYWRDIRKISTFELLSNTRLDLLKHARLSEIETGVRNLYLFCCHGNDTSSSPAMVNMSEWFFKVIINMMMGMIARRRPEHEESQRLNRAIKKFIYLLGVSVISDVIPFPEWLDLQGHIRSMKNTAKDLDHLVRSWFDEHLQSIQDEQAKEEYCFIDAMFSSLDNYGVSKSGHKKETIVKATATNLIIGGTHTTSITLTWALSLLLNHPEVLQQAQEELDKHVGKERWVEESDFKNLTYLLAIIKETLRLYPPIPLSIPRESIQDCSVGGFHIPKGTVLFVNMWKLHRDPRVWLNPCEFQPERFLSWNGGFNFDVRGQHFEYIPFSSGRRSCPGISSAMEMSCLILARLLQGFNLSTPMNAPIDTNSTSGSTLTKATPLQAILTPRLPHNLYKL